MTALPLGVAQFGVLAFSLTAGVVGFLGSNAESGDPAAAELVRAAGEKARDPPALPRLDGRRGGLLGDIT